MSETVVTSWEKIRGQDREEHTRSFNSIVTDFLIWVVSSRVGLNTRIQKLHKCYMYSFICETYFAININKYFFNKGNLILFISLCMYVCMSALGLCCCAPAFSSCRERGLLFVVVRGLLTAVASLVVEHGLQVHGLQQLWHAGSAVVAHRLQSAGSVVVAHGLSCSASAPQLLPGIFLDQGSNPCPLHWQADS